MCHPPQRMSTPPARARRAAARTRREAARERIVAAAERLLRDRPYRELSVEEVMAEAGLSRAIFYRHFDGLPELVLSLFDTVTQALMTQVQGAPGPGATRGILQAAVDAYAEHGGLLRAVDEAARHDAGIEAAYRAVGDAFTRVTAAARPLPRSAAPHRAVFAPFTGVRAALIGEAMGAGRVRRGDAHELAR